ncbi:uncharacterized protein [Panulirus ornatus]|uniref:uncharacterized protein isoform X1 n=1 Tax=Panulirus ornatus TaxID=150431 RepID=UPI003A850181
MSSLETPQSKIPVVDLGQLSLEHEGEPSEEEWQRVARQLYDALTDIGFVYLSNHGIPEHQISTLFKSSKSFFSLDQEKKNSYSRNSESLLGYLAMNTEILDKEKMASELRESFLMRKDGRFPDEVTPSFRPAVGAMIESCTSLTTRILTAIAIGLDLDRDFFTSAHKCMIKKGSMTSLRVQHYPPVPDDVSEDAIRCGAHTDYGTITLLFQDDMGGLQVRDREGNWIDAEPIPGTIVVNVGDLLQFWTAYKLIATTHRVLIPSQGLRRKTSRLSISFFVNPDDQVLVKPPDGSSASHEPIVTLDYLLKKVAQY